MVKKRKEKLELKSEITYEFWYRDSVSDFIRNFGTFDLKNYTA